MSPELKRERQAYLRFRFKTIALAIRFIYAMRKEVLLTEKQKLRKKHNKVEI